MNVITSDESPEKKFHSTAQINKPTKKPTNKQNQQQQHRVEYKS